MDKHIDIQLSALPIDPVHAENFVHHPSAGGIVHFVGTVRNQTQSKEVIRLEFEAYESMALKELKKIAVHVCGQWPVQKIAIHHRVGVVNVGGVAVVISVSCPHRKDAFEACAYAIDKLKETVPIWKKEIYKDGEIWVSAHP